MLKFWAEEREKQRGFWLKEAKVEGKRETEDKGNGKPRGVREESGDKENGWKYEQRAEIRDEKISIEVREKRRGQRSWRSKM